MLPWAAAQIVHRSMSGNPSTSCTRRSTTNCHMGPATMEVVEKVVEKSQGPAGSIGPYLFLCLSAASPAQSAPIPDWRGQASWMYLSWAWSHSLQMVAQPLVHLKALLKPRSPPGLVRTQPLGRSQPPVGPQALVMEAQPLCLGVLHPLSWLQPPRSRPVACCGSTACSPA
jgi:hypothetical protein